MADFPRPLTNPPRAIPKRRGFPVPVRDYSVMDDYPNIPSSNIWLNRARALAQGATLGFGDEAAAGLSAGLAALHGNNFKDAYSDILDDSRKEYTGYSQRNPGEAIPLELAGGLVTGKPISKLGGLTGVKAGTLPRAAAEGSIAGGLYGIGTGEDSGSNRLSSGVVQAMQGGVAGPFVQGAFNATARAGKYLKDLTIGTDHSKEVDRLLLQALGYDNLDPKALQTLQGKLYEIGGPNTESLLASSARSQGSAPTLYQAEADSIRKASHDATKKAVQDNILPPGSGANVDQSTKQMLTALQDNLKPKAKALYDTAFAPGANGKPVPLYSPDLADLGTKLTAVPEVFSDALKLAKLSGKDYPTVWSKDIDKSKLWTGATKDVNSQTLHEQIVPDLQFWDSVKRSLWANNNPALKNELGAKRKELVNILDNHSSVPSEYKDARQLWEENAGLENAHQAGRDFFNAEHPYDITSLFNGVPGHTTPYTVAEQEMFMHGLSNTLMKQLGTTPEAAKELSKALSGPTTKNILSNIMDPASLEEIQNGVGNQVAKLEKADLMTPNVSTRIAGSDNAQEHLQKIGSWANFMSGVSPGSVANSLARAKAAHAISDTPEIAAALQQRFLQPLDEAVPGIVDSNTGWLTKQVNKLPDVGGPFLSPQANASAGLDALRPRIAPLTGQFVGSEPAVPRDSWEEE